MKLGFSATLREMFQKNLNLINKNQNLFSFIYLG